MWTRLTGKSDSGSSISSRERGFVRRRRSSESTRAAARREKDLDARSVVSSVSTRRPSSRHETAPSSIASYATAFDDMPRTHTSGDDRRKAKDHDKKNHKSEKRRSTRSGSASQAGGYRGEIVDSPTLTTRSFSGPMASDSFSSRPSQAGAPMMSGALPVGSMGSHLDQQFPGMNPATYAPSALPGVNPFGAAADYYQDSGASVHHQPGVRPQPPSVSAGHNTSHLVSASAHPKPISDTGMGAAADFYRPSTGAPSSSKPTRPSSSSMPGAFVEDGPPPPIPSRPSKPAKSTKLGKASAMAGGAALAYVAGHSSSSSAHHETTYSTSNSQHTSAYTDGTTNSSAPASTFYSGSKPHRLEHGSNTSSSSYPPPYSGAVESAPPPKPARPGKSEKQSSASNAKLYALGAAGLAAYGVHQHHAHSHANSHSHAYDHHHSHSHSNVAHGASANHQYNSLGPHSSSFTAGGMAQRHEHTGPVSRFVDWWKDYEDVQKMEEYTEYIGVCRGCFDPRSSVLDAPRKHHYNKRRSNEYMRPSGGIEKQSRYSLKEKKSYSSFSSGDERRRRRKSNGTSAAGWVAAGLGGLGLAKASKAVFSTGRDDFDDTYSIKSGREAHSRMSHPSRSRSRDRKSYSYGHGDVRHRSHSRDRLSHVSHMSVGVTSDKKDYQVVRRRSRSRSRSSSEGRSRKSGFLATAIGASLAGAAFGAATKQRRESRSRSPRKIQVRHHHRDSSDDERRSRRSQQLRHRSSRSSASGASVIEIGRDHQSQAGFLGGFFAAPPTKVKKYKSISHQKKRTGFFNFGNGSSSSSDSEMAFGTGYVRKRQRPSPHRRNSSPKRRNSFSQRRNPSPKRRTMSPKRKTSEERLKATLAGLGATAAAIAAAKAARSSRKRHNEVVISKEHRHRRRSSGRSRTGSRYGDDEWEDLPDDDTSVSSEDHAGLVYGDYDWKKSRSQESLASNGSGTNKWSWRWGFGKTKRRSSENLYDNIASTSLIGPVAAGTAGALTGAVVKAGLNRHDSESSSVHTLQSVYPVAPSDPNAHFDARQTSLVPTSQPLLTTGPGSVSLQQPQPIQQVPESMYSTQPGPQHGYVPSAGAPIYSQTNYQQSFSTQFHAQNVNIQAPTQFQAQTVNIQVTPQYSGPPPLPRRANSSPIQTTSWKRDAAIAGLAASAGAVAVAAANKAIDRPASEASNVRFSLTEEQVAKEMRESRREQDRRDEEADRHREQQRREDDLRREEEDRRREQQRRDDENRQAEEQRRRDQARREEEEHHHRELQRQQEESRKYMEAERLAKVENDRRATEQRRQYEQMQAREAQEAEEMRRQEREAAAEAQRQIDREIAVEKMHKSRRDAERQEIERMEAAKREADIQEDLERRRREREAQEYFSRYESDRERRRIEYQPTGSSVSSVATDVRRKEQELQERERDIVQPSSWKSTAIGAVAAGVAATIASEAISSYKTKDKKKSKDRREDRNRESSSSDKQSESSRAKAAESSRSNGKSSKTKSEESSKSKNTESAKTKIVESSKSKMTGSSKTKTAESSKAVIYEPSKIVQDYFDDEIFNPDLFKEKESIHDVYQDLEERYNAKPVSQADFFAPKELLESDHLPKVKLVDPNEGITDLHIYQAHDDYGPTQPIVPPYPPSYSFTATRDGRSSSPLSWPVPSLNLIQATPPGSRTPSVRSVSMPPSPATESIPDMKDEPKPEELNRARSRVSWGENQFHHFEVPTPDSYREQFVSEGDLKNHDKTYPSGKVTAQYETSKPTQNASPYQAYRPPLEYSEPGTKEIAPSIQPKREESSSIWNSIIGAATKKTTKTEPQNPKAAAAALTTAAAAVTTAAMLSRDEEDGRDYRHDNYSTISNPFSDTHAASSTADASTVVSSAPSVSTVVYSPQHQGTSQQEAQRTTAYKAYSPTAVSTTPSASTVVYSPQSQGDVYTDVRKTTDETKYSSKTGERQISSATSQMHVPGSFDEVTAMEESTKEPVESSKLEAGKKSRDTDKRVVTYDTPKSSRAESVQVSELAQEIVSESDGKLSKTDKKKKKKSKATKRPSVDSWELEQSELSLPTISTVERDIRDIEPSQTPVSTHATSSAKTSARSEETSKSSSKVTTAALASGFAAIVGASMAQDQNRMASDLERARGSLKSAGKHTARDGPSYTSHATRNADESGTSSSIPSMVFQDHVDVSDTKTPKHKGERKHSSEKWSPSVGSPLRTETKYEDYMGSKRQTDYSAHQPYVEAPKIPTSSPFMTAPQPNISRHVNDSGYYAPDDVPRKETAHRDSGDFSGSVEERGKRAESAQMSNQYNDHAITSQRTYMYPEPVSHGIYDDNRSQSQFRHLENVNTTNRWDDNKTNLVNKEDDDRIRPRHGYDEEMSLRPTYDDDDDAKSMISVSSKHDDPERIERRRLRREARAEAKAAANSEDREPSRDRGYDFDDNADRKRRHRRRETDERTDDWDTKSAVSDAHGERRRKHKSRDGERDGSPESKTRSRSSIASDLGDEDKKSSRRRSRRDGDDDNVSVISSVSRYEDDRASHKERKEEKRSSGLFGMFSKSKESLLEPSGRSSKARDDDEEHRRHRRRKHRSDRGSTYGGSDDDDMRSTISSSSHREKRSSRSERGEGERREFYDDKVHRSSYTR